MCIIGKEEKKNIRHNNDNGDGAIRIYSYVCRLLVGWVKQRPHSWESPQWSPRWSPTVRYAWFQRNRPHSQGFRRKSPRESPWVGPLLNWLIDNAWYFTRSGRPRWRSGHWGRWHHTRDRSFHQSYVYYTATARNELEPLHHPRCEPVTPEERWSVCHSCWCSVSAAERYLHHNNPPQTEALWVYKVGGRKLQFSNGQMPISHNKALWLIDFE